MDDWVLRLLDAGATAGAPVLVAVAFGLAFGETALLLDLITPGDVGMVLVGAVAARADAPLWWVVGAATVGATLGDSVGWWLGSRYGRRLLGRFPRLAARLEPSLIRAEAYFDQRGGAVVFWGRFVGALRGVVSFVAGTAQMPYRRFLRWNLAASACWSSLVVGAGYLFGRHAETLVTEIGLPVALGVMAVAAGWWVRSRRRAGAKTQVA
ncbi:MAG: DedA family protein [Actinomycetota bacterium]